MGQKIEILGSVVLGDVSMFDLDRSLTGQDGETYRSQAEAAAGSTFPAALAERIFSVDETVESVFVASNSVSVRRNGGWDDDLVARLAATISEFFLFYV